MKFISSLNTFLILEEDSKSYPFHKFFYSETVIAYIFNSTVSGLKYDVKLMVPEFDEHFGVHVEFEVAKKKHKSWLSPKNKFAEITNTGEPFTILKTVTEIVKEYLKDRQHIKHVYFRSGKTRKKKGSDDTRKNMYIRLIKKEYPNFKIEYGKEFIKIIIK